MTALWIVGYVLGALIVGRVMHLTKAFRGHDSDPSDPVGLVSSMIAWPLVAAFAALFGLAVAAIKVVTMPTRAERAAARRKRLDQERDHIRSEARRLGLPLVEDFDG